MEMAKLATADMRHFSRVNPATWDVSSLSEAVKAEIKGNLVAAITHDEAEYQAILSYLHLKYPDLMDVYYGDGCKFQWKYKPFTDKIIAYDQIGRVTFDMYGLIYYDKTRDMEPVAVGGSYLRETGGIRDPKTHKLVKGQVINKHTTKIRVGHGYRLFIDPDYRRLGLAQDQWITEAQLYRDSNIHYQKEQQTYAALKVTQSIFDDPSKCYILHNRDISMMRQNEHVKCIMDYFDDSLVKKFDELPENLKDFRNEPNWSFLEREHLTIKELTKPWE